MTQLSAPSTPEAPSQLATAEAARCVRRPSGEVAELESLSA